MRIGIGIGITQPRRIAGVSNPLTRSGAVGVWEFHRPNFISYSQQFSHAVWSGSGTLTATEGAITAPDGSMTGALATVATDGAFWFQQGKFVGGSASSYTPSIHIKQGTAARFRLRFYYNDAPISSQDLVIDWATLASNPNATAVGDGWYRVWLTKVSDLANDDWLIRIYPADIAAGTCYLWGAQLNYGATPSPYVATTNNQIVPDISGNGNHLTRKSLSEPVNTGSGFKPDGVDDFISSSIPAPAFGDNWTILVVIDPTKSAAHEGLIDKYHPLIGWQNGYMIFRTFASEPGAGYFLRCNYGAASGIYALPSKLTGPRMYAMQVEGAIFRLIDCATGATLRSDTAAAGASGNLMFSAVSGVTGNSEMPSHFGAYYSRAVPGAELVTLYGAVKASLATRTPAVLLP